MLNSQTFAEFLHLMDKLSVSMVHNSRFSPDSQAVLKMIAASKAEVTFRDEVFTLSFADDCVTLISKAPAYKIDEDEVGRVLEELDALNNFEELSMESYQNLIYTDNHTIIFSEGTGGYNIVREAIGAQMPYYISVGGDIMKLDSMCGGTKVGYSIVKPQLFLKKETKHEN
ncbi:hypothetical protein [Vibrio phage YC]|uniref:Uncharacterized protein n=1 Tax=Vibrio phage YC TaxID=2267403 RepID=A0A384ZS66_9CAUD|nr:hypothetical protein HWB64_gp127 [Vibrio phage YC]AXC34496.1 hypothetical protein [Vibrio phage YC]